MSSTAQSPLFTGKLADRWEAAERTMSFRFERPVDWTFRPGQFVALTLINPTGPDPRVRAHRFSISGAPCEEGIVVTTRMRNTDFKRALESMPLGAEIQIEGPFGGFRLHTNATRPAVFLAGGIGVTPARSILVQATHDKLPHRLFLFYSNRRPEDAPFLEELQALERRNPNFRFIPTMTRMQDSSRPWQGETGRIDYRMLSKHLKSAASFETLSAGPIFYISGPPTTVQGLRAVLAGSGTDDDDIRTEEFKGY